MIRSTLAARLAGTTLLALGLGAAAVPALAQTVVVTDANLAATGWVAANVRGTATGAITDTQPRSGNGSVEFATAGSTDKYDFTNYWGFQADRTLGNLTALGYEWRRDSSSTTTLPVHPAMRLYYDADGDATTTADRGLLIYEAVYNGANPIPTDSWQQANLLGANLWMRQYSPSQTIELYDKTLADWQAAIYTDGGGRQSDLLGSATAVLGIEFGVGSGWNGTTLSFVDNVTVGFGGQSTTYNFETAAGNGNVPVPGTLALLGAALGAASLGGRLRARRAGRAG